MQSQTLRRHHLESGWHLTRCGCGAFLSLWEERELEGSEVAGGGASSMSCTGWSKDGAGVSTSRRMRLSGFVVNVFGWGNRDIKDSAIDPQQSSKNFPRARWEGTIICGWGCKSSSRAGWKVGGAAGGLACKPITGTLWCAYKIILIVSNWLRRHWKYVHRMKYQSMHYNHPTTEVVVQCTATLEQLHNIQQCRKMMQRSHSNETPAIGVGHVPYR